jgi:hypothetical protein
MREVAKVLGFAPDQIDELARSMDRWGIDHRIRTICASVDLIQRRH